MAGIMRGLCVVVILFSAWQACIAEELVNLVEPMLSATAPLAWPLNPRDVWKMFDHDKSTYQILPDRLKRFKGQFELRVQRGFEISPTKYRITMPAHLSSKDYPSSWTVKGTGGAKPDGWEHEAVLSQVSGAVFENGVYEGALRDLTLVEEFLFEFEFDKKRPVIAEIELLGPRSRLDDLWPYGKYPCSQRLGMIPDRKKGPKNIFVRPKDAITAGSFQYADLRKVFDATADWRDQAEFSFSGDKAVFIGAKLPGLPMVHEVAFDNIDAPRLFESGIRKVVLQGNFCQPHCPKGGSKGWVRLGAERFGQYGSSNRRILVENPGNYEAYRLKFIPKRPNVETRTFYLSGIIFLGCTA